MAKEPKVTVEESADGREVHIHIHIHEAPQQTVVVAPVYPQPWHPTWIYKQPNPFPWAPFTITCTGANGTTSYNIPYMQELKG